VLNELRDETSVDVLDRVESESLSSSLLENPNSPVVEVGFDVGVIVVDVGEHEVVVLKHRRKKERVSVRARRVNGTKKRSSEEVGKENLQAHVSVLSINSFSPSLSISVDLEDGCLFGLNNGSERKRGGQRKLSPLLLQPLEAHGTNLSIVINSSEAVEVPLEARVLVSSSGKGESSPSIDVVHSTDLLVSVVVVDLSSSEGLGVVSSSLVVEDLRDGR